MPNQQHFFDTISNHFTGVIDVDYEGSEEYPDSLKVFLNFNLRRKNPSTNDQKSVDLRDVEQWIRLSLEETFKDRVPDPKGPSSILASP